MDRDKFRNLRKIFPDNEKYKLLLKKLPFPYDYFNSFEKLMTDISKITIKDFHNKLNKSDSSEEDFKLYNSTSKKARSRTGEVKFSDL